MSIIDGRVDDLRPSRRPVLHLTLDAMPETYAPVMRRGVSGSWLEWTVGQHVGHFCEVILANPHDKSFNLEKHFELGASGHFNNAFNDMGPYVDVELSVREDDREFDLDDAFYVMKLSKARALLARHAGNDWSYYMSDYDGQRGLRSWELIEKNPKCMWTQLYHEHAHTPQVDGRARVNVDGIQFPLCSHHLHLHNQRSRARRLESEKSVS